MLLVTLVWSRRAAGNEHWQLAHVITWGMWDALLSRAYIHTEARVAAAVWLLLTPPPLVGIIHGDLVFSTCRLSTGRVSHRD